MPSRYDKDITININGNAEGLSKTLRTLDNEIKNAKSNIKALDEALKYDPKNMDLLNQKYEELNIILKATENKLTAIKQAQEQYDAKGVDKQSEKYKNLLSDINKFSVELTATKGKINAFDKEIQNASNSTDEFGEEIKDTNEELNKSGNGFQEIGNIVQGSITKIASVTAILAFAKDQINVVVEGLKETANVVKDIASTIGTEVIDILSTGTEYNASIEQYKVRLSSFAQVGENVNEVFSQLREDALKSPFSVDAIMNATTMLLSTGKSMEEVRNTVLALGNAIAKTGGGDSELTRMAQNLQQISNAGKATALDLKQFAYAGVDIYGILKDYANIIYTSADETPVSFENIAKALQSASSEGGKYFEGMSMLADTYTGSLNRLSATWQTLTGVIASSTTSMLSKLVIETTSAMNDIIVALEKGDIEKVGNVIKGWITNCLEIIKEQIPSIITYIGEILTTIIKALNNSKTISAINETLKAIINALGGIMAKLIPEIKTMIVQVLTLVKSLFADEEIRKILTDIAEGIVEIIIQGYTSYLKAKWGSIFSSSLSSLSEITSQLSSVKMTAGNISVDTSGSAWNSYTGSSKNVTIINNNTVDSNIDVESISRKTARRLLLDEALG